MKLVICGVVNPKEKWLQDFLCNYQSKIKSFISLELDLLKPKKISRSEREAKKKYETRLILERVDPGDFLIICDEKGKNFSSREFSQQFKKVLESGRRRVVVAIGGAYGFSEEACDRADLIWSFSSMTMNHHLAYCVALEQLYRAFTINNNIPYHND